MPQTRGYTHPGACRAASVLAAAVAAILIAGPAPVAADPLTTDGLSACRADPPSGPCARAIIVAQAGSSGGSVVPPTTIGKKRKSISGGRTDIEQVPTVSPRGDDGGRRPGAGANGWDQPARAKPRRTARPATAGRPAARCPSIVGVWSSWASGMVGRHDTTFHADGTATHRVGFRGRWWCDNGQLHIAWPDGRPGAVSLSADRKRILAADGSVHMRRD